MKAVWLEGVGGPEVMRCSQRPDPSAGAGEVVVRVKACSLNHLDIWVRRGKSFPRPIIPGSDAVGVVESVGQGVEGVEVGMEVVVYPGLVKKNSVARSRGDYPLCEDFLVLGADLDGALAQRIVVPACSLLSKPPELGWHEAACLPIAFMTAWHMLFTRGRLKTGETVLIHSAGSGVSHGAIQMAHRIGARVLATSSSESKLTRARELGADEAIHYQDEDVSERVADLTGGRGVDVIIDHNGQATWETSIASLAKGGRLVICGVTQGAKVELDLGQFFYASQSILGSTLGTPEELAQVIHLAARGDVTPVIDHVFTLDQIQAAHQRMEDPQRFGKVVVDISTDIIGV